MCIKAAHSFGMGSQRNTNTLQQSTHYVHRGSLQGTSALLATVFICWDDNQIVMWSKVACLKLVKNCLKPVCHK